MAASLLSSDVNKLITINQTIVAEAKQEKRFQDTVSQIKTPLSKYQSDEIQWDNISHTTMRLVFVVEKPSEQEI